MNRNAMLDLAHRFLTAPDNDARLLALGRETPDRFLGRLGLAHRPGTAGRALWLATFTLAGAAIGAGVALLFAPMTGEELRGKVGRQAERMARSAKKGMTAAAKPRRGSSSPDRAVSAGRGDSTRGKIAGGDGELHRDGVGSRGNGIGPDDDEVSSGGNGVGSGDDGVSTDGRNARV